MISQSEIAAYKLAKKQNSYQYQLITSYQPEYAAALEAAAFPTEKPAEQK